MAKRNPTKGDTLVCVPCGAELIISKTGAAYAEQWCCGVPMKTAPSGSTAAPKRKAAPKKKAPAKKPAARKQAGKKAPAKKR